MHIHSFLCLLPTLEATAAHFIHFLTQERSQKQKRILKSNHMRCLTPRGLVLYKWGPIAHCIRSLLHAGFTAHFYKSYNMERKLQQNFL